MLPDVITLSVEVPLVTVLLNVSDVGLTEQVIPADARPPQARATAPANPLVLASVYVEFPVPPLLRLSDAGLGALSV